MAESDKDDLELFMKALDNMPSDMYRAKFEGNSQQPKKAPVKAKTDGFDREIDLHGLKRQEAVTVLSVALKHSKGKGETILVITGRGNNSQEGISVIRQSVMSYLAGKGAKLIKDYRFADRKHGGDGAFIVRTK